MYFFTHRLKKTKKNMAWVTHICIHSIRLSRPRNFPHKVTFDFFPSPLQTRSTRTITRCRNGINLLVLFLSSFLLFFFFFFSSIIRSSYQSKKKKKRVFWLSIIIIKQEKGRKNHIIMIVLSEYSARVIQRINFIGTWGAVVVCCRNFMICYAQYKRSKGKM